MTIHWKCVKATISEIYEMRLFEVEEALEFHILRSAKMTVGLWKFS